MAFSATCNKVLHRVAAMFMLSAVSVETKKEVASLWTTQVAAASQPLKEAAIDSSVSAADLREAAKDAQARAAAFARPITEALLRKSV